LWIRRGYAASKLKSAQMNAAPAKMVPVSGQIGGRTLGVDGF
jgi:hypothetical protein